MLTFSPIPHHEKTRWMNPKTHTHIHRWYNDERARHGGSWNRIGFAITHTFIGYRACLRFSQRGADKADHD